MGYVNTGKYIIRSALNEDLVLITVGGSKSKGAKISTGAFTESDNRCYWHAAIPKNTSYNSFYNVNAGNKNGYMMSSSVSAGNAITQNAYKQATGAWSIVDSTHTMTVNGATVNTYYVQPSTNGSLYLTVPDNGGELYLTSLISSDSPNQEFYFEASTCYEKKLATPNTLRTSDGNTYVIASGSTSFYPQWKCSSSAVVYEMRYRSRRYNMDGNLITQYEEQISGETVVHELPEGWSSWTGWTQITARATLNNKKKYTGVMTSNVAVTTPVVDNVNYSQAEIQVQVRLTSAKNAGAYNTNGVTHGAVVSQIINQWKNPSLTISAAIYSPDGLALTYSTDYTIAGSSITIHSIKDGDVTLIENYAFTGQDYLGDLYLNCDELYSLPNANDAIVVNATITEENGIAKSTITQNLTVVYDSSWGLTIEPEYEITDRLTVLAGIPAYSTLQLYMERPQLNGNSLWVPCDEISRVTTSSGDYVIFEFAPPYNANPNLMWIAIDEQSNWTSSITAPAGLAIYSDFYSWFWIDEFGAPHAAILKYRVGKMMQPSDDITLAANKFITTGRDYPVFRYSKSIERVLDIEGAILNDEDEDYCTLADFESMAIANHCVYRQPDGKWYQVAITGIKFTREEGYTTVSIEQEAETR